MDRLSQTDVRACAPVVADKLVYCHEALALHAKLQDAAYRPEAEPWDEDSDSDTDQSDADDEDISLLMA